MRTGKIKTMVVGKEAKVNKNNEPYGIITIMDGADPLALVTKDDKLFQKAEVFKPCEVVLDIKVGKYTKVEIVEFQQ